VTAISEKRAAGPGEAERVAAEPVAAEVGDALQVSFHVRPARMATKPEQCIRCEEIARPGPFVPCGGPRCPVSEVASDWIWETDSGLFLTFVSKRFGETSGIPWSEVNRRPFGDLVIMGFDRSGMGEIEAAIEARVAFQGIYRVDPAPNGTTSGAATEAVSGTRFWRLSGGPSFDPATGAFAGYRGTGTDVTVAIGHEADMAAAVRRAEAAEHDALRARQMLVYAIEAIPEGFVLHDADDRLVLCNTRYREIYGLTPDLTTRGARFEDTLRATSKLRAHGLDDGDAEAWVAERLHRHRALDGHHFEERLMNGCWLQVEERRTSDGGTVSIRIDVTEARRQEALERERERTVAELQAARTMQTALLPSARLQREIIAKSGLDIASRSVSCTELGGDLWGLSDLDHGRVGVYTVDVAGHGATAALNTFRLHTLVHELGAWLAEPARFLKELNTRLAGLLQPGAFATMFYGVLDPHLNSITYAAAGSPPPLIRSGRGLPLTSLDSSGLPLGIIVDADYACFKVDFEPGGVLFLYSDILTDAMDEHGHRAGEAGAFQHVQDCAAEATAEAAVERICAPFFDPPDRPLSDDLTVVCIRRP
jgi:serine phosphatase RsbU (regulator of sigma subunit)